MAGYTPSPEQASRCRKCRYWMRFNAAGMRCCQYILETGHSRGVIPVRNLKGEEKIMKPIDGAKDDRGKLPLTLVPTSLLRAVAKVRAYGVGKYGEKENWRTVAPERYQNALYRHFLAYLDNPDGIDAESGLPHIYHLACNAAFLVEFYDLGIKGEKRDGT